jgi:uncharacterized RDD family membrane protein YckC
MDTTHSATLPPALPESLVIAGFWRRPCALFVDLLMLGVVGWMIGEIFFEPLARIGDWAKIIGFVLALAYFGIGNSRIFGGQTLAKRWLGLRVVDVRGATLSPVRALARYVVLGVPFFFNGFAHTPNSPMNSVLAYFLAFVIGGGVLAIIYLYVFNRRTRQSLHDLAVGSYVVQIGSAARGTPFPAIWHGHLVVAAVLALLALTGPYVGDRFAQSKTFAGILPLYRTLSMQPHVISARVVRGSTNRNGDITHSMQATLRLDAPLIDDAVMARHIAQMMAKGDPDIALEDSFDVTLTYGFNMGIASGWRKHGYSFKRDELK